VPTAAQEHDGDDTAAGSGEAHEQSR